MAKNICEHGFSMTMNRLVPYRLVIKSLHISSTLTCPSSLSWVYIIFHMKTNIQKYLVLKNLPTTIKTYAVTSSPNCQLLDFGLQKRTGPNSGIVASIVLVSPELLSTLFFLHLLYSLRICSTCSHSDVRFMFLHYHQYKTKTHECISRNRKTMQTKIKPYPILLYLMLNTQFLYQQNAHFILCNTVDKNFNITIYKNFIGLQRSIGQKKKVQYRAISN